jgi:hypothetical protein
MGAEAFDKPWHLHLPPLPEGEGFWFGHIVHPKWHRPLQPFMHG